MIIKFDSSYMNKLRNQKLKTDMTIVGAMPESIYNPITAMGFSAMFTFQADNTKS